MSINLSGFFSQVNNNVGNVAAGQQTGQSGFVTGQSQSGAVSGQEASGAGEGTYNSGLKMLKDMLAGDIFSGKVMDVQDNNILLQMSNGRSLPAHLSEGANIQRGQNLTFMVESNTDSNIVLKPLMPNQQQAVLINKALDGAQFPVTDSNINIVKELIRLNMPLNADTLSEMVKNANKFPDTDINTLANLLRLEMPVTAENIAQFEAYKSYEHSITGELNNLSGELAKLIAGLTDSNNSGAGADMGIFGDIVELFYGEGAADGSMGSASLNSAFSDDTINNIARALEDAAKDSNKNIDNNDLNSGAVMERAAEDLNKLAESLKSGNMSLKDFLSDFSSILKNNPGLKENLKELLSSKDMNDLIKQMVDETLKLNPSDVAKEDGISNYYNRVKSIIEKAEDKASKSNGAQSVMKDMQSIKSNIDFMNDLNRNMTYFQMPIKFSESDANGELYVFTNKKALAAGSDNISALLHLDMDNLGPIDIYVKLAGKNVSTNFCLESEELLDFVYSNIDKLNARLEALGYDTKFEMKVAQGNDKFDFVDDFLEKDVKVQAPVMQYILDVKA